MTQRRSASVGRTNTYRRANVQERRNVGNSGSDRNSSSNYYMYDNTARVLDPKRNLEITPEKQRVHGTRRRHHRVRNMSLGYLVFLIAAFFACGCVLINYINIQSELNNKTRDLALLESQLNDLKLENDEAYNRITSSINLEEIRRVAIAELGMVYAEEGQIISYHGTKNDYMRKVGQNVK